MSWEHVASLITVLQRLVALFEQEIGPLPDVSKLASLEVRPESEEARQ
jgi:hypothetical protein